MTSKKSVFVVIIICVILVFVAAISLHHSNNMSDESDICNVDVVAIKDFSVQDVKVGTYTNGSMIIQKTSEKLTIRVIGSLNVGNDDFGGVCFYYGGMKLNSIVTSYRDNPGSSGVMHGTTFPDKPLGSWISFGRVPADEPGDGFFEIMFEYNGDKPTGDIKSIQVGIAVGSYVDANGYMVVGSVYEEVEIEL